ncbi:Zn(2)-C6 fungal-type domain-containing protein [Mycena indigotica]|uniref:Zn(2)-C6 fungal-type domain-containing protein n=1 Tax=Mycena indigotica TaxID=2126181 RepID=A0A8H6T6E6_9AGAR|nr:Zn(2)-C6 fungal-type domain-containing protein [Mycena indigotica]KAF7312628.1 Zn(2)-C6 fungal-type domain-containing protein [Mycena indigotica]
MSSAPTLSTQETAPRLAKFKTPTCVLCRKRKLRCDGNSPCSPCTRTRTPVVCTYVAKTIGQLRSELPKGGACTTCRQRKRRCDGHFPCRTCQQTGRSDACAYRDKLRSPKTIRKQRHDIVMTDGGSPLSSSSASSVSSSRPTTPQNYNESCWPRLHFDNEFSGHTCRTEAELDVNVLSDGLDMLQCGLLDTSVTMSSYDYESRASIISQHILLSPSKLSALCQGDLSGTTIYPALVRAAELLISFSSPPQHFPEYDFPAGPNAWGLASRETKILSVVRAALASLHPDPVQDAVTCVQLQVLLHAYYSQKRDLGSARECISAAGAVLVGEAGTIALKGGLSSVMGHILNGANENVEGDEVRAALAQVVFLDIQAQLVDGAPSSLDGEVYDRFRHGVMTLPNDPDALSLRAQSFLALYDTKQLVAVWNNHSMAGGTVPTAWGKRFQALVFDVERHIASIHSAQIDGQVTREALIAAHAALIELSSAFPGDEIAWRRAEAARVVMKLADGQQGWDWSAAAGVAWAGAARVLQP